MRNLFLVCWFLVLLPGQTIAEGYFVVSEEIRIAYDKIMQLKLEEAQEIIDQIKKDTPDNLLVYHIENYIDFFTIFISEEKEKLTELEKNKKIRLDKIRSGDRNSPYYNFSQAEILLQWALARSKFYDDAAIVDLKLLNEVNMAYRLLESNEIRFPEFVANKKSLSLIHALASYMPGIIKKLFRIKGSLDQGRNEIEWLNQKVENTDFLFKNEVHAIYSYMLLHLFNEPDPAWQVMKQIDQDPSEYILSCFLFSTVAIKTGKSEYALEILKNRPVGEEYFPFVYLDYLIGKCKLYKQDSTAITHIEYFQQHFQGRHFIKDAFQKMAWFELTINKSGKGYKRNMELCKKNGRKFLEDDQQAMVEYKKKQIPDPVLLKARMHYDGGYYEDALNLLDKNAYLYGRDNKTYLEYCYRKARILHAMGVVEKALKWYETTLHSGIRKKSFYSANSALQIALIHERMQNKLKAKQYFEICLKVKSDVYKEQLQNKAKAGLSRINRET